MGVGGKNTAEKEKLKSPTCRITSLNPGGNNRNDTDTSAVSMPVVFPFLSPELRWRLKTQR